jgi:hypothetical protein
MTNFSYPHIEDYIEIIAGYRLPNGKNNSSIFITPDPLISLARYDVKVIESLADQTLSKKVAYSDRQSKLAVQLVLKYERQLLKHNINIDPARVPVFRMPIREIDRTSLIWLDADRIKIKFPYDNKLIDQVRETAKVSPGRIFFSREERVWAADLTEHNLNWIYTFATANRFNIDDSVRNLMNKVLSVESTPYAIELAPSEGGLTITNAANSLIEYINEHLGGFVDDNLLRLIDYAPILGYTVNTTIEEVVNTAYGKNFWKLCSNREIKVEHHNNQIVDIVKYAKETNRFPIYIYEPDLSGRLLTGISRLYSTNEIAFLKDGTVTDSTKIVYATKIPKKDVGTIPLLVSSAGMMFGGDKEIWLQNAEKVVFFSKEVYNKQKRGREVCKLD